VTDFTTLCVWSSLVLTVGFFKYERYYNFYFVQLQCNWVPIIYAQYLHWYWYLKVTYWYWYWYLKVRYWYLYWYLDHWYCHWYWYLFVEYLIQDCSIPIVEALPTTELKPIQWSRSTFLQYSLDLWVLLQLTSYFMTKVLVTYKCILLSSTFLLWSDVLCLNSFKIEVLWFRSYFVLYECTAR